MKSALIVYATREGQTGKVATRISTQMASTGANVRLVNAKDRDLTDCTNFDRYVLLIFGASMHAGGLEKELTEFVNGNKEKIELKQRSFFLVLLSAATKDPALKAKSLADACRKMEEQLHVSFDDVEMIAGALRYSQYSLPLKWMMRRIARNAGEATDMSRDYEYTDWQQVERYATRLVKTLA